MIGKLPECWIAPEHLLDLRARVRLRHTLVDDRGEWQQRIHAVLYHHGIRRPGLVLLTAEGRAWLEQAPLPETAREQITVGLRMIDALDAQLPALDRQLRAYARRQAGCKALMAPLRDRRADVGRDPRGARRLPPLHLLAPRRPVRRPGHHRVSVRSAPLARAPEPPRTANAALGAV